MTIIIIIIIIIMEMGRGLPTDVMPPSWSERKNEGRRRGNERLDHLKKMEKKRKEEKKPKSKGRNEKRERGKR